MHAYETPALPNRFPEVLLGLAVLTAALVAGSTVPAHAQTAASILTENDSTAAGFCNPQIGADSSNLEFNLGCCGAPGLRACVRVLNAGKGTLGLSAGCTSPDLNVLRVDPYYFASTAASYADADPTLCNLPWPPAAESANLLRPDRPPTGRDFTFYVTSDTHYWRIGIDFNTSVNLPAMINQFALNTPPWPANDPVTNFSTNPLHGFQPPVAIVLPGDITTDANSQRMGAYRFLWERGWNAGSINFPVYMGFGNHDAAAGADWGVADPHDAQRRWDYQVYRTLGLHVDRNHTGCLVGVDLSCLDEGDLGGSLNYSWDWEGVHFVMLHTWAGDTNREYMPPLGMDGLTWLKNDLAYCVGSSGRPVVLFQHYPLNDRGQWYFPTAGFDSFEQIIDSYNVVAALVGHTHELSANPGIDLTSGAHVEDIEDGSGGDCGKSGCIGGNASFLAVHMTDTYFEVSSVTFNDTDLPQPTVTVVPSAWTKFFPAGESGEYAATCRRLINPARVAVDPTKISATIQSNGSGGGNIIVRNLTSTAFQGTFLASANHLHQWDYTDTCYAGAASYYLSVSTHGIPGNGTITIPYHGTPDSVTLYSVSDGVTADQSTVDLGTTPVTVKVAMLSGGTLPAFTTSVDQSWVTVVTNKTQTEADFTFSLNPQTSYPASKATFTFTPSDSSLAPVTVSINRLVPVQISANLPDAPTVQGRLIISDAYVILNNVAYGLPYTGSAVPGSTLDLNISIPFQVGKQISFVGWSDNGSKQHSVTVPNGPLNLAATFSTSYLVTTSVTPDSAGFITLNPAGSSGYFPADSDLVLTVRPANGYHFVDYEGSISETAPQYLTEVTKPLNITARFAVNPTVTVSTNIPAIEKFAVLVGTQSGPQPQAAQFAPNAALRIAVPPVVYSVTPGVRYSFSSWSDGSTYPSRAINGPGSSTTYQALYTTQYMVTVGSVPSDAGSMTGAGWINAGAQATIHANPLAGFELSSFSGSLSGSTNPAVVAVNAPMSITANFSPIGPPHLYAAAAGGAADSTGGRLVPIVLQNVGTGGALAPTINSITQIKILGGSGTVSYVGDPTPPGTSVPFADIPAGKSAQASILMNWPATAIRIQMTVNFTADNGAYQGSTTLNLFR